MVIVTLACRECNPNHNDKSAISFASEFEPKIDPIPEMQQHMDINFPARCGSCFACNWEVIAVAKRKYGNRNQLHAVQNG